MPSLAEDSRAVEPYGTNDSIIKSELQSISDQMRVLQARAREICIGLRTKYVTDFNGQPCGGMSRPSLKGKEFTVKSAIVSMGPDHSVLVWDGDYNHCYARIDEIEFI